MKLFQLAALLLVTAPAANAQALDEALVPYASPISAADPSTEDLAPILGAVRVARVIGIGEPTHGTAEVVALKQRVIQDLVATGGVRHLVLEVSVGEGSDFDDYINGRRDDLTAILRNVPLWMFQTTEFADMLRWLRAHNRTAAQPVRIYGMEAQYADRSARHALAYVHRVDPTLANHLLTNFGPERVASDTASATAFAHLYGALSDSTLAAYQSLFLGLRAALDSRRDAFVAATSAAAFVEARRHVAAIGQFTSLALLENQGARAQLRDYIMAVNVADVVATADNDDRVVVWAHNEHIWKREGNGGYDVLGRQLARWFGPQYYAIGFDFGSGAYRAPGANGWVHEVPQPEPTSFTAALAAAGGPNLFLDLRAAMATPSGAEALREAVTVRATAGGQLPMRNGVRIFDQTLTLGDRFDGLLFVATSTPTTMLPR